MKTFPLCIFDLEGKLEEFLLYDPVLDQVVTTPVSPPRTQFLQHIGGEISGPIKYDPSGVLVYDPESDKELINNQQVSYRNKVLQDRMGEELVELKGGSNITGELHLATSELALSEYNDLTAVSKSYVQNSIGQYLPVAGGKMDGPLELHAWGTKDYEDRGFDTGSTKCVTASYLELTDLNLQQTLEDTLTKYRIDRPLECHVSLDCKYPSTDQTVVSKKWVEEYLDCVFGFFKNVPEILLSQQTNVPVGRLKNAVFSANCKIIKQKMCGGGPGGSNYPLSFEICYQTFDEEFHNYQQNLYYEPCAIRDEEFVDPDEVRTEAAILAQQASENAKIGLSYNHIQARKNQWFKFAIDLMKLDPPPYAIRKIGVRSGGFGSNVMLTNVSVKAETDVSAGPQAGLNLLYHKVISDRNMELDTAQAIGLGFDFKIVKQNRGCPLSVVVRYHTLSGLASYQRNFAYDKACIDSGGSTVVNREEWSHFQIDLLPKGATAIEDITIKGTGISFESYIANFILNVAKWEGGADPIPAVPGVPGVPAKALIPEIPGVPAIPGTSIVPECALVGTLKNNVWEWNHNPSSASVEIDLNIISSAAGVCPVVVHMSGQQYTGSNGAPGGNWYWGISTNGADESTYTTDIQTISGLQTVTLNLKDVTPAMGAPSKIRILVLGDGTEVQINRVKFNVTGANSPKSWVLKYHYNHLTTGENSDWGYSIGPYGTMTNTNVVDWTPSGDEPWDKTSGVNIKLEVPPPIGGKIVLSKELAGGTIAPSPWQEYDGMLYKICCDNHSKDFANGLGGGIYLATIKNQAHQNWICTAFHCAGKSAYHIGYRKVGNSWKWDNPSIQSSYTNWYTKTSPNENTNHATIMGSYGGKWVGSWKKRSCLIEKPATGVEPHISIKFDVKINRQHVSDFCPLTVVLDYETSIGSDQFTTNISYLSTCLTSGSIKLVNKESWEEISLVVPIDSGSYPMTKIKGITIECAGLDFEVFIDNLKVESIIDGEAKSFISVEDGNIKNVMTVIENNGSIDTHIDGSNHLVRLKYQAEGLPGTGEDGEGAGEIIPLTAAIPPIPAVPAEPAIPPIPAQAAVPGVDPDLIDTPIHPGIEDVDSWTRLNEDGTINLETHAELGPMLHLQFDSGLTEELVCQELVKTGTLDGNYSGWDILKMDGDVTFPSTTFERSCDTVTKTETQVLQMITTDFENCDETTDIENLDTDCEDQE